MDSIGKAQFCFIYIKLAAEFNSVVLTIITQQQQQVLSYRLVD